MELLTIGPMSVGKDHGPPINWSGMLSRRRAVPPLNISRLGCRRCRRRPDESGNGEVKFSENHSQLSGSRAVSGAAIVAMKVMTASAMRQTEIGQVVPSVQARKLATAQAGPIEEAH